MISLIEKLLDAEMCFGVYYISKTVPSVKYQLIGYDAELDKFGLRCCLTGRTIKMSEKHMDEFLDLVE